MEMLARSVAAFRVAIRLASASIIRCCAAVGGSAALRMRHTPCGCRSAHLVEVLTNFRLPIVPTNAASEAMPLFRTQSAAEKTSLAPHDSKARLQNGHDSQGFMAKPCTPHPIAQRVQLFKLQTANVGGRGVLPSRSLGGPRGIFSHVREYPPYSVQRHWRCFPRGAARRLKLWEQVNDLREHEKRRLNA